MNKGIERIVYSKIMHPNNWQDLFNQTIEEIDCAVDNCGYEKDQELRNYLDNWLEKKRRTWERLSSMEFTRLEHLIVGDKKEILKKIFHQYLVEKVIPAYSEEKNDSVRLVINQYFFPEEIESDTVEVLNQIGRELVKKINRACCEGFNSTPRDYHTKNLFKLLKEIWDKANEQEKKEGISFFLRREEITNINGEVSSSSLDKVMGKFSPRKQKEWAEKGFDLDQVKEWLDAGLNSWDTDFVWWLVNIRKITPQQLKFDDITEEKKKYREYSISQEGRESSPFSFNYQREEKEENGKNKRLKRRVEPETDEMETTENVDNDENSFSFQQDLTSEMMVSEEDNDQELIQTPITKEWNDIHPSFVEKESDKNYHEQWEDLNFTKEESEKWIEIGFHPKDYSEVRKWRGFGFTSHQTGEWLKIGLKLQDTDYACWLASKGYNPNYSCIVDALREEYNKHKKTEEINPPGKKRTFLSVIDNLKDLVGTGAEALTTSVKHRWERQGLENELEKKKNEISNLETKKSQLEEQTNEARLQLNEIESNKGLIKLKEFQKKNEELESRLKEDLLILQVSQKELIPLKEENKKLAEENGKFKKQLEEIRGDFANLKKQLEVVNSEKLNAEKTKIEAETARDESERKQKEVEKEKDSYFLSLREAKGIIDEEYWKLDYSRVEQENRQLTDELERAESEKNNIKSLFNDTTFHLNKANEQIVELHNGICLYKEEIERTRINSELFENIEEQLNEKSLEIQWLKEKLNERETKLLELNSNFQSQVNFSNKLVEEKNVANNRIFELESWIDNNLTTQNGETIKLKSQIENFAELKAGWEESVNYYQKQLEESRNEKERIIIQGESEKQELINANRQTENELVKAEVTIKNLQRVSEVSPIPYIGEPVDETLTLEEIIEKVAEIEKELGERQRGEEQSVSLLAENNKKENELARLKIQAYHPLLKRLKSGGEGGENSTNSKEQENKRIEELERQVERLEEIIQSKTSDGSFTPSTNLTSVFSSSTSSPGSSVSSFPSPLSPHLLLSHFNNSLEKSYERIKKEKEELSAKLKENNNKIGNLEVKLMTSEGLLALEKKWKDELRQDLKEQCDEAGKWSAKSITNLDLLRKAKRKITELEKSLQQEQKKLKTNIEIITK